MQLYSLLLVKQIEFNLNNINDCFLGSKSINLPISSLVSLSHLSFSILDLQDH